MPESAHGAAGAPRPVASLPDTIVVVSNAPVPTALPFSPSSPTNPPPQLVAPADIAIYGTLCALSSYSRAAIKAQILENSVFGAYVEQEPYVRELIEAYMASKFKVVLEVLGRYSVS